MCYICQELSSLQTFCSLTSLPESQKFYDKINKIADVSKALINASMKKAAAEEKDIDCTVKSVVGGVNGDGICDVDTDIFIYCRKKLCVGLMQNQIGFRLRKLEASLGKKLSDGKICWKCRLTVAVICKLTISGNTIRANSQNVNEMRQAVWARISSTDELKH
ncbi:hypothetical protein TNCV_203391 [Trichonephila clavipes]|nr:hypothetical protein TNCV_203391 [Trichonephila clavipes]